MKYLFISNNVPAVASALGIQSYKIKDTIFDVFMKMEIKYPNFNEWYDKAFVETLMPHVRREIILAIVDNKIAGILILKDFDGEKKVCNIVVVDGYRKQGVASQLFEMSFDYLGTLKPSFSVSEDIVPSFSGLIRKYRFKLTNIDYSYYKHKIEFFYN